MRGSLEVVRAYLLLLAVVLPFAASAVIFDGPDFARIMSRVVSADDDATTCTAVAGVGLRCSDGRVSTTTRPAPAIPCGAGTAGVNTACVVDGRMQCYGSGAVRPGCDETCAGDAHSLSTDGWPTSEGELTIVFRPAITATWRPLVQTGGGCRIQISNSSNGTLQLASCAGITTIASTGLMWADREYEVKLKVSGGVAKLFRDGVEVASGAAASIPWGPTASLGAMGGNYLNGTISRLTWSAR